MRSGRGGLAWVHINTERLAFRASMVSDDEARQLWPKYILRFTSDEQESLRKILRPRLVYTTALASALRALQLQPDLPIPSRDLGHGRTEHSTRVHLRGIIRVVATRAQRIASLELVEGDEAWRIVQPLVDPS